MGAEELLVRVLDRINQRPDDVIKYMAPGTFITAWKLNIPIVAIVMGDDEVDDDALVRLGVELDIEPTSKCGSPKSTEASRYICFVAWQATDLRTRSMFYKKRFKIDTSPVSYFFKNFA